jgi:predicted O-methyltransferase YrrM
MSILNDPKLEALLTRLHAQSEGQGPAMHSYFSERARSGNLSMRVFDAETHRFVSDKLVALERDKAELCYALCRALRAKRVVEAGTSFGVSTLYLAAAVRDNVREDGGRGVVIGTEYEPEKAKAARANFAEAGLSEWIDLREGDLRESLAHVEGPVDFLLLDIWVEMVMPTIERIAPLLRPGAIVIADNTTQFEAAYADFFAYLREPKNRLRSMTLPFQGGLELCVRM